MLSITHGVTGALISTQITNPLISTPLILASHYLLDYIPHWDIGTGLTKHLKSKRRALFQEIVFDLPLSIILVYLIFRQYESPSILPWYGWFIGLLPDFLEFPYLFLNLKFFPIKNLARLHAFAHRSTNNKLFGLLTQITIILFIYLLVN